MKVTTTGRKESKPELQNIAPTGGFKRGEFYMISSESPASKTQAGYDLSKIENATLANLPRRSAKIDADVEADCLFCTTDFGMWMEGASESGQIVCKTCKSVHIYGKIEDGAVRVVAYEANVYLS